MRVSLRAKLVALLVSLASLTHACRSSPPVPECTSATPLTPGVPGSPGHLLISERNPNGASELATLMRTMAADLGAARAALSSSAAIAPLLPTHRRIRCSWPTDARDRNEVFDAFAVQYLAAVKQFDDKGADVSARRGAYGGVVAACRACHEQTCDGPLAVIDKLAVE